MRLGRMTLRAKVAEADHSARMPETPSLSCCCNIGEMPSKVPATCAIAGCHRRVKMTLAEREELRRVGRENNATAVVVCPTDVKAAFNFEFDDIDIDVPLGELLVEASKETPRWRVMLTPLPGTVGEPMITRDRSAPPLASTSRISAGASGCRPRWINIAAPVSC